MKSKRDAMAMWRAANNEANKIGHGWGSTDFYNRIVLKDWHEEPLPPMRQSATRLLRRVK